MIKYDKLFKILNERGYNSYTITVKNKIVGPQTWKNMKLGLSVSTNTIDNLCRFLDCQPGDLLEYIPDNTDMSDNYDSNIDNTDNINNIVNNTDI